MEYEDEEDENFNPEDDAMDEGPVEDDDEEEIEKMFESRNKDVWSAAGVKKSEVIRELMKHFGSMVKGIPHEHAIPDNSGRYREEDKTFHKLLDASKHVVKAKK